MLKLRYIGGEINLNLSLFLPAKQNRLRKLLKIIREVTFLDWQDRNRAYAEIEGHLLCEIEHCKDKKQLEKYNKNLELVKGWKK